MHTYNPNTTEAEAGGSSVQGQPDVLDKNYLKKPNETIF